MNYSDKSYMCRVDFFTENGKWKYTDEIDLCSIWNDSILTDAFAKKMIELGRYKGLIAICLDPYHQHSFPLMYRIPE